MRYARKVVAALLTASAMALAVGVAALLLVIIVVSALHQAVHPPDKPTPEPDG
jgi:hypothetical protein